MALGGGGSGGGARGIEAGQAYVRLGAKDDLSGALKRVGQRFAEFGKMALAATGVGGILGGLGMKDTLDDLSKIQDVAKAFGITGKAASGLFGVLGAAGGEFKENVEGVIQFSDTLNQALSGGDGQGAKLFKDLSVTAKELEGMSVDEQFYRVHAAIRELPQPLQEAKLALLGGTDSMKQWQRLLSMSSDEVREMAASTAIGSAELEDASRASKAMAAAGAAVNRVWQQVVIAFAPLVADGAKFVSDVLKPITEWAKGRTLADVWEEITARVRLGWEEIQQFGRVMQHELISGLVNGIKNLPLTLGSLWTKIWGGMTTAFAAATIQMSTVFVAMLEKMREGALVVFSKIMEASANPLEAGKLLAAMPLAPLVLGAEGIKGAMAAAAPEIAKLAGGVGGELNKFKKFVLDMADVGKGQAAVDAARANLELVLAGIENRRNKRLDGGEVPAAPALQKKLDQIGKSLGTFGAGSFLKQGFGVQSADVGKQIVKEQQKGNDLLGQLVDKANPLVFT